MALGRHRVFADRAEAGRLLAEALEPLVERPAVVLGLPRGGVPVAAEVAQHLDLPLDLILVRKLGVPGHGELAAGAIGEGGVRVLDRRVMAACGVAVEDLTDVEAAERIELERQAVRFRRVRPRIDLRGSTAVVVDDGVATGSTARAACLVATSYGARRVHLAVPVSLVDLDDVFHDISDATTALVVTAGAGAVSRAYRDFRQIGDVEVVDHLTAAAHRST